MKNEENEEVDWRAKYLELKAQYIELLKFVDDVLNVIALHALSLQNRAKMSRTFMEQVSQDGENQA